MQNKIFTFPYHDPNGKYNQKFRMALPQMKEHFSRICLSTTPSTLEKNGDFLNFLVSEGCLVFRNVEGSKIGDHYRNSLKVAVEKADGNQIYFGFIDRTLYAINSEYSSEFWQDMQQDFSPMILFERSELAWSRHPDNYREIEQVTNRLGRYLVGKEIELASCGIGLTAELAGRLMEMSTEESYSAGTEWIFCAQLLGEKPIIKKTDWLSWEDPYIDGVDAAQLKSVRENDPLENIKRLEMNIPIINLLTQKRFYPLTQNK
jgi:hypothetical protein